jgi:pectinesterase
MRKKLMKTIYVTPNSLLQEILDNISEPTTIYMKSGIYRQKIDVKKNYVTLIGESRETTIITYGDYAKKANSDGREYNTFRTYTVNISGDFCKIENLTIENDNLHPEKVGQCVALSVTGCRFLCRNVRLNSTQDTLFTAPFPDDLVVRYSGLTDDPTYYDGFIPRHQLYHEGPSIHLFENCQIEGTVDFIFGCARAFFVNCTLLSHDDARHTGYVAAPAHPLAEPVGYCFIDCNFFNDGAKPATNYLARPWRDFGKCNFIDCRLQSHIAPVLFDKWNDTYRDKTARFHYYHLSCDFSPAPAAWSHELTESQAKALREQCTAAFADFQRECKE